MPDISMCVNKLCEKKETCYRFKAVPSDWQPYMHFDEKNCKSYIEVKK